MSEYSLGGRDRSNKYFRVHGRSLSTCAVIVARKWRSAFMKLLNGNIGPRTGISCLMLRRPAA